MLCGCCSHEKVKELNKRILKGGSIRAVSQEFGVSIPSVRNHRKFHLPWRSRLEQRGTTIEEQLEDLKFELQRLQFLAMSGEKIGGAIQAIVARRNVLELEARMQHKLGAVHSKLFPATPPQGEYEIEFISGKPRAKAQ